MSYGGYEYNQPAGNFGFDPMGGNNDFGGGSGDMGGGFTEGAPGSASKTPEKKVSSIFLVQNFPCFCFMIHDFPFALFFHF